MSDMLIPYSREAEQGVLGAILSDPIKYADEAIRRLKDDHFYCSDTRTLFVELRAMADASRIIEPVNVVNWLREQNQIENVTVAFVTELATSYTTLLGFDQWCDTLTDRLARRTIIAAAHESKTLAMDMTRSWKEAMQAADSEMSLLQVLEQSNQAVSMATVINETVEDLSEAMKNKGKIRGVRTGLPDLDRTINGLEAPDLFVIGARPGMGKTNLLLRLMESMTFALLNEQQVPTLMFSLEMGRMQVGRRVLFSAADVEQSKGKTGFLSKDDEANIGTSAMKWQKAKVWVDDTPELTIADIRARIRAAKRKWGIRVVMIDYIQIIEAVTKAGKQDERLGIKEVVGGLKAAAKQCDVIIIALAQASRGSEDQPGKRPTLRDFDGSSAIEKWADYAAFVHRPSKFIPWERLKESQQNYYGSEGAYLEVAELLLVKSRHSSEAVIPLRFIAPLARFDPATEKLFSNNAAERQKGYQNHDATGRKSKAQQEMDDAFGDD